MNEVIELAELIHAASRLPKDMCTEIAMYLVERGYEKKGEAKWMFDPDGTDWGLGAWVCSACGVKNDNLPGEKDIKPLRWAGSKYCPNCGFKIISYGMKGD